MRDATLAGICLLSLPPAPPPQGRGGHPTPFPCTHLCIVPVVPHVASRQTHAPAPCLGTRGSLINVAPLLFFLTFIIVVLGPCCCSQIFSSYSEGGSSPVAVCVGFSMRGLLLRQSLGSRAYRLSNCSTQAQLLHGTRDLPRPGIKPMSPALAGRFLTTGPPGKSSTCFLHPPVLCCLSSALAHPGLQLLSQSE